MRSYSNHSQDTGCTIMDDCMTKASDVFPTQTQIENLNSSAVWLECATCPCNKQTLCKCHTRGQEPRPHKEFTTAGNIHLISNIHASILMLIFHVLPWASESCCFTLPFSCNLAVKWFVSVEYCILELGCLEKCICCPTELVSGGSELLR